MQQQAINTFNEGLNYDLNPLTTPNNVMTDCINGTFITFNGDELALQNDAGNTKISWTEEVIRSDSYYGNLYNWWVTQGNIAPTGFHVPTLTECLTLEATLGESFIAGGKLKETGTVHWNSPNVGATNEVNFNAVGSGGRNNYGGFNYLKTAFYMWTYDEYIENPLLGNSIIILNSSSELYKIPFFKEHGFSLRFVKDDSNNTGTVTDYDGNVYNTVTIGSQVWTASNFRCTHYNDGTAISYVEDDTIWPTLTTAAYCMYPGITITETILNDVKLSDGFYPLGIKEYGGVLYIVSGKLPDVPAADVQVYIDGDPYTAGEVVSITIPKLFYEKKVTGTHPLPLEGSDNYWKLIGNEEDYNNAYGFVEIGSYPSPEASDKRLFNGDQVIYDNSATSTIYRWYPTGIVSCAVGIDLKNTGYQNVEEKYQSSEDGIIWTDVIGEPHRTSLYYNTTACPAPFNWAGISVDSTSYNIPSEVEIPYAENTVISVQTPIKSGFNYVFLSIPQSKTLLVKDSMNNNITSSFSVVGTDNRPTHTINNIYRKNDAFATDISTTLYITIY